MRIASLLPSATEIVAALGAADELVGISHECDFPSSIVDRPVLTSSRIDPSGSSRAIDVAVRTVLTDALSVYTVDEARLGELRPDVIVTQDLCEVCAVSLDDVRSAIARVAAGQEVALVSLSPTRLSDVLEDIERVARAIDRESAGARVRAALQARIEAIATRARAVAERPRVVTIEWIDPLMLGGTWMPDLVELAGGRAVGVEAGRPAPTITSEALAGLEPEVVVLKPCGFSLPRTLAEREVIVRNVLERLPAGVRVYATDGNAFFNRPGPRLVESLEILAACTHPQRFEDFALQHAEVIERLR